jgi:hypothetical protein
MDGADGKQRLRYGSVLKGFECMCTGSCIIERAEEDPGGGAPTREPTLSYQHVTEQREHPVVALSAASYGRGLYISILSRIYQ